MTIFKRNFLLLCLFRYNVSPCRRIWYTIPGCEAEESHAHSLEGGCKEQRVAPGPPPMKKQGLYPTTALKRMSLEKDLTLQKKIQPASTMTSALWYLEHGTHLNLPGLLMHRNGDNKWVLLGQMSLSKQWKHLHPTLEYSLDFWL